MFYGALGYAMYLLAYHCSLIIQPLFGERDNINGLIQENGNPSALAMELRLSPGCLLIEAERRIYAPAS